jgi:hypothetical protein
LTFSDEVVVDISERVARRHQVLAVGQISCKELTFLLDVGLFDHVLHWSFHRCWLDGVDGALLHVSKRRRTTFAANGAAHKSKAKKTITCRLLK